MSSISSENLFVDSPASRSASGQLACYRCAGHGDRLLPRLTAPPSSFHISLSSSSSVGKGAEVSLQAFALKSGLSETLSKIVLRSVASAMSSVADDRNDHFLIFFVVGEYRFESFRKGVEFALSNGRGFNHLRLNLGQVQVASINAVVSVPACIALEECVVGLAHQGRSFLVANQIVSSLLTFRSSVASAEVV